MKIEKNSHDELFPAIPGVRDVLARDRLYRLMDRALKSDVLVLSAGEGYGKTVAVNSFLRQKMAESSHLAMILWHQAADMGDQTRHFWESYTQAVSRYKAAAGEALREIGFPITVRQFEQWREVARREFTFTQKMVIVVDDFYRIKLPAALDFIDTILVNPIPHHLLILICRGEPQLNMLPLISKGNLTRIGAEELLFTVEETAAYFRLRGMTLSAEETGAVCRDTEGWPLLLDITASALQKDGGRYRSFFLDTDILRLYAEDHLAALPPELRRYLIKLSLFNEWPLDLLHRTAGLLPAGYRNLAALEAELETIGAVVYYDYYLPGYRPHRWFHEYLREKRRELPFEAIREVSVIAARWCLENNLTIDAALHYERITDYAGFSAIVDSFEHRIPVTAAAALLEITERLTSGDNDTTAFQYMSRVIRGRLLWNLARFEEAAVLFQENIARYQDMPPVPAHTRILAESWNYLGNMLFIRHYRAYCEKHCLDTVHNPTACFENAEYYYRLNPYPLPASVTINYIGSYVNHVAFPARAGELERWLTTFINNLPRAANVLNGHLHGMADLGRAELAFFQGNLDAVEQYARAAVIKSRENRQYEIAMRGLFLLLRITLFRQMAEGSVDEFIELWKQKDAILKTTECPFRNAMSDIFDGWLHIQMGEPLKTSGWLRGGNETSDLFLLRQHYECLVKAMYCYAEQKYDETLAILDLPENRASLGSYLLGMVEMDCLKAVACYRMGNETDALEVLKKAYQAAAPHSVIMPFLEHGYDMRSLLTVALNGNTGIPRPWLEQIRSLASAYGKNLTGIAGQFREKTRAAAAVYLTRQELTVLKGLSLGRTREEIAVETGYPLSAVKNQISVICAKLDAVNRADAVRIASGLGLLG